MSDIMKFTDKEGIQPYSDDDFPPDREVITTPYDAPVRTLIDEIRDKTLIVNPDFQRRSVWDIVLKSRLIESLLLNIPIPVLYFAENDDGTRVVVDGQQRLRAISEFHSGTYKLKKLQMLPSLNDKRWTDLSPRQSRLILNRTLRCVVISAKSEPTLRFEMFERLNTLGMSLSDQELRNCVCRGDLNNLLEEIVTDKFFLSFFHIKEPNKRLEHHELVLRYFALKNSIADYRPPLKTLLSDFMNTHRNMVADAKNTFKKDFQDALNNVGRVFGTAAFRRVKRDKEGNIRWDKSLNRSVYDIQMHGLRNIPNDLSDESKNNILEVFIGLCLGNAEFLDSVSLATADRKKFYRRLFLWGAALNSIGLTVPYLRDIPDEYKT